MFLDHVGCSIACKIKSNRFNMSKKSLLYHLTHSCIHSMLLSTMQYDSFIVIRYTQRLLHTLTCSLSILSTVTVWFWCIVVTILKSRRSFIRSILQLLFENSSPFCRLFQSLGICFHFSLTVPQVTTDANYKTTRIWTARDYSAIKTLTFI